MENQGNPDEKELRYQDKSYSTAGHVADVTGVLRNDIIIKTLRVAKQLEGVPRPFLAKRRIIDKAA